MTSNARCFRISTGCDEFSQHFLFEGAASSIARKLLGAFGESLGTLAEPMVHHVLGLDMLMAVDAHEVTTPPHNHPEVVFLPSDWFPRVIVRSFYL